MSLLPSSPLRLGPTPSSPALPTALTPNSKVRAMMARLDDSDEEMVDAPRSPLARRAPLGEMDPNRALGAKDASNKDKNLDVELHWPKSDDVEESGGGPDDWLKFTTLDEMDDDDSDDGQVADGSAYDRVRTMMLMGELDASRPAREEKHKETVVDDDETEEDESEEEEEIVPKGRLAARLHAKNAPKSAAETEPSALERGEPQSPAKSDAESAAMPSSPPSASAPSTRPRLLLRKKAARSSSPADGPDAGDSATGVAESHGAEGDASTENQDAGSSRFLELLARKREERAAREAELEEKHNQRLARLAEEVVADAGRPSSKKKGKKPVREQHSGSEEDDDPLSSQKLEEASRPAARKASKKALEELSRETQRINRNMQLAHEARTKKKITKESLLQRFNFRTAATTTDVIATITPADSSSAPQSDTEGNHDPQTPPTSPASAMEDSEDKLTKSLSAEELQTSLHRIEAAQPVVNRVEVSHDDTDALPSLEDVLNAPATIPGKVAQPDADAPTAAQTPARKDRPAAARPSAAALKDLVHARRGDPDSDSDLEVVPQAQSALLATFERIQPLVKRGAEGQAMKTLRALAHVTSPNAKAKTGITQGSLQTMLRQKARQQAARERAEKIQDLRDRGVIVRTEEERERDQVEMEDMLEKARKDNEELARKEKDAAKREAREAGEELLSSDEDEDYEEPADANERAELDLSGSEDEDEEVDEDEDGEGENQGLIDDAAVDASEESETEEAEQDEAAEDTDGENQVPLPRRERRANLRIVDDEEDDDVPDAANGEGTQNVPSKNPFGPLEAAPPNPFEAVDTGANPFAAIAGSPTKNPFAADDEASAPMGLTQAFAATMADSQDQAPPAEDQDSLARLEPLPPPDFLSVDIESQAPATQVAQDSGLRLDLHLSQSQVQYDTLPMPAEAATQSEMPDPTQDVGFALSSPAKDRFGAPAPTVETVPVTNKISESPVARRKGRLQRGTKTVQSEFSDDEELADDENDGSDFSDGDEGEFGISVDAFNVMKRAAKKTKRADESFDKKKSDAKAMVEEQAQESEDEYAGLGGASDDDSNGEMDEEMQKMIDEGAVDVNERQLAAFHANKERQADEKAVEKLFKDINNGGLRRKRAAEFDLSESDDDIEDQRRRKRAEFARMRKALLADANVGKIAEDPKKMAFLRAIEDREDGEFDDVLVEEGATQETGESQGADGGAVDTVSATAAAATTGGAAKRKRSADDDTAAAPAARRARVTATMAPRKPLTLAEIRASVSFLTEDPHAFSAEPDAASDDERGEEDRADLFERDDAGSSTHDPPQQRTSSADRSGIVDRLSRKRADRNDASAPAGARLAFAPAAGDSTNSTGAPGFRVPSLLRRATTSSLTQGADAHGISHLSSASRSSSSLSSASTTSASSMAGSGAGGKRSSVNFVARKNGIRDKVEQATRRRREDTLAQARRKQGAAGGGIGVLLRTGTWD